MSVEAFIQQKRRQWREVLGSLTGGGDYRFTLTIVLRWFAVDNSNYLIKARYEKEFSSFNLKRKKVVYRSNFSYVNTNETCVCINIYTNL